MNSTIFRLFLVSLLSVAPALAQSVDQAQEPALRGPSTPGKGTQSTPIPSAGEAVPLRGAQQPQVPSAAAQTPIDYAHPPTPLGTPSTDNHGIAGRPVQALSANFSNVSASAKLLETAPLMRCRDANLKFVEITLRNDSTQVALVHGDIAEAKVGDSLRTAASARYIGTVAKPKLNTKGRVYTGLVLAGSWGLAGPMFYELVTPDQHAKRYLGTAIGVDGSRHEIEDQRFGLRVLMPGEETVGWLAFECPTANDLTSLLIPVNYSKSSLPSGSLFVQVKPASAVKPTSPSAATTSASSASSSSTNASGQGAATLDSVKSPAAPANSSGLGTPSLQPPLR